MHHRKFWLLVLKCVPFRCIKVALVSVLVLLERKLVLSYIISDALWLMLIEHPILSQNLKVVV